MNALADPARLRGLDSGNWSLLLLTTLMGVGLLSTTWFSWAAAKEAGNALIRSQGYARSRSLTRQARDERQRPLPRTFLERHLGDEGGESAEVFHLLTYDPVTQSSVAVGQSRLGSERVMAEVLGAETSGHMVWEGEVALLVRTLPAGAEQRARHPEGPVPQAELTRLAVEFSPDAASRLQGAASRALLVGGTATLLLIVISTSVARLQRKRAALERRLADERSLAALGEMSAVLAHEIRNPLASLKGHAQLLAESLEDNERAQAKAERVVGEALRLELLSTQLLDFVRSAKVEGRSTELASFFQGCVAAVPEAEVQLDLAGAPERWPLDPIRLQQVLVNLLKNAAQAAPESPVECRVEERGGALWVSIRDQGPGLPPGQEEEIFRPFFTTRTRGTGLGLAVAKRVVELHGGELQAKNLEQGGAEFSLRLPEQEA